jgi:hypothetical protein
MFCDVYDATAGLLIETKGTVAREALRMAIGQLMDYRRFAPDGTKLAVLVPEKPRLICWGFSRASTSMRSGRTASGSWGVISTSDAARP